MGSVSTIFQTIFVDLFIGIQSMIWILLGILLVADGLTVPGTGILNGLGDIGTLMIVAFTYSFGTIVVRLSDGLASLIFFRKRSPFFRVWTRMTPDGSLSQQSKARTKILFKEGKASEYISYLRTTFRISASTTINAILTLFFGLPVIFTKPSLIELFYPPEGRQIYPHDIAVSFTILMLSLATLAIASTVIAAKAYVDRLKEFDELISGGSSYLLKPTGT